MSQMFGERINEFVLSIDIMDKDIFDSLLGLIYVYVNEHLNISHFSVLDETLINNCQGLQTLWASMEERQSYTIDRERGYASHIACTFGENKPMWVVSRDKQALAASDELTDLWSGVENPPPYNTQSQDEIRTSVMHPLRKAGRPVGVVEFAAEKYIEPTPASLEETQMLASVISKAYHIYDVRRAQRENTNAAMRMLEESLRRESWMRLALPQMFIAYAGAERLEKEQRAGHKSVIETIRDVVDEFAGLITPVFWEDVNDAGNITEQVIRDISNSEFGLCYFSEPSAEGEFMDNSNVLFEAGMMQALANSPSALLKAWLPVREKESEDIPFDIAAERILKVARDKGKLNKSRFADDLRKRLRTLIAPGKMQ